MIKVMAPKYRKASKKEKGAILDEFIQMTGYDRCYASQMLKSQGQKVRLSRTIVAVKDVTRKLPRKRPAVYDQPVKPALHQVWRIMDCICGKRLAPMLPELIPRLEQHDEIEVDAQTRDKLCQISAATIDRVLSAEKKKWALKGRSHTKPGTWLKQPIPIRTVTEWHEQPPGLVQIDLVAHEGGDARGDFLQTLDVTDVATGWTETHAVRNKAQKWVVEALEAIRARFPFPWTGIHSDNGSEVINAHLVRFCQHHEIAFTRTRPYRRNDNCYVEQKNYTVVRQLVGYFRYDTPEELALLNRLYGVQRQMHNFFLPQMKLRSKTREGSKVTKTYDSPRTPYARILASPSVSQTAKEALKAEYATLNPAKLRRQILALQGELYELAVRTTDSPDREQNLLWEQTGIQPRGLEYFSF